MGGRGAYYSYHKSDVFLRNVNRKNLISSLPSFSVRAAPCER
jgi:hypothetical protein